MEREDALEMLRSGKVKEWNEYRTQNPNWIPDLSDEDNKADLSGLNLSYQIIGGRWRGVNLSHAKIAFANFWSSKLQDADLSNSNLQGTNFSKADLKKANLSECCLKETVLTAADLSNANMYGADLTNAVLKGSNFSNTKLSDANFRKATFGSVVLLEVDLSNSKNLDSSFHIAPSYLSIGTLILSKGNIAKEFLIGCGIPNVWIEYLPSLAQGTSVIQYYSCFISYSSNDEALAEKLYNDLQSEGIRCWYAPQDMKIGDRMRIAIDEAIRKHEKLLLILSKTSIHSQWVEQEIEKALEKERNTGNLIVFPIRIDSSPFDFDSGWPSYLVNTRNIGDFSNWEVPDSYDKALKRLLRDLKIDDTAYA